MKLLHSANALIGLASLFTVTAFAAPASPPQDNLSLTDPTLPAADLDGRLPPASSLGIIRKGIRPSVKGCSNDQHQKLSKAWSEAGEVAKAHTAWVPGKVWQAAMDLYMGTQSAADPVHWYSTGPLKQDVLRQYGMHKHSQKWSPYWSYATFYCDENKVPHKDITPPHLCELGVPYYTWNDPGTKYGWDSFYTVFCSSFFDDKAFNNLEDVIEYGHLHPFYATVIDKWMTTRAALVLRASYAWKHALKPPAIPGYEREDALTLVGNAIEEDVPFTSRNPANWEVAGLAIYAQQQLTLDRPPTPLGVRIVDDPLTNPANLTALKPLFLETAPYWFVSPVPLNSSTYDDPHMTDTYVLGDPADDVPDTELPGDNTPSDAGTAVTA